MYLMLKQSKQLQTKHIDIINLHKGHAYCMAFIAYKTLNFYYGDEGDFYE